ncbi:hypothetical protein [Legionella tunisiensis]|uniref:hypothetical protein n=1 Tax=Legionella tunisiensis TaxID=1034944 RepID=UPI0002F3F2A9|nr:hypothetical protein [Legionella tunisiensis]
MPKYSREELLKMDQPYELLVTDITSMSASSEGLMQLSRKEKLHLVTTMVLQCPVNELNTFKSKLQSLEPTTAIHALTIQALQVRTLIEALINPATTQSHTLLLENFNADLFNQFQRLSHTLVNQHATLLATSLVDSLPQEQEHELITKLRSAFSNTQFLVTIGQALLLKRQLELLKGETPYELLKSPEFNIDLFHKFHVLVTHHLTSKTERIAQKLAEAPREDLSKIGRQLEGLARLSHDSTDLYREISSFFSGFAENRRQEIATAPVSIGISANNIYAEGARRENRTQPSTGTEIIHSESLFSPFTPFQ